jgi:DNA replication protein DnaC
MTEEETMQKLLEMRLREMATTYHELQSDSPHDELSFADKVGLMVDREWTERENRKLTRLLKAAKLPMEASLEDVWCEQGRGLTKAQLRELALGKWIRHHHNVVVIGKTGCGKSYLGAALAQAACRMGYRALYTRMPRLAHELAISRADGTYVNKLTHLAKLDVLVLDDFLISPLKDTERRDLLEVLEDRYDRKSTVITSQVPTKNWHEMLADPTIADAICDRVVHNAHALALTGPSIRKKKGMTGAKSAN